MFNSLWVAKTGMEAQDIRVATIANNMANASSNGFKKDLAHFSSLGYSTIRTGGGSTEDGEQVGKQLQVGLGVQTSDTSKIFTQGSIKQTEVETDLYVGGEGFFALEGANGGAGPTMYTREGHFEKVLVPGTTKYNLVHVVSGRKLLGDTAATTTPDTAVRLPLELAGGQIIAGHLNTLHIDSKGEIIEEDMSGSIHSANIRGYISLVQFGAKSGLTPKAGNLFVDNPSRTGGALYSQADDNGFGVLRQGALEVSNVTVIDEMVDMIEAQRGYEMGAKVLEKTDEMMSTLIQRT